jgi:hypothetical protein
MNHDGYDRCCHKMPLLIGELIDSLDLVDRRWPQAYLQVNSS